MKHVSADSIQPVDPVRSEDPRKAASSAQAATGKAAMPDGKASVPDQKDANQARADDALEERRRRSASRLRLLALLLLVGGVVWGGYVHLGRSSQAEAALEVRKNTVPVVRVMEVKTDNAPANIDLPGTMQAFESATLYARATGYIAQRNVDIGSRVKKGDILAVISAPDLDQQLAQGRAQLNQYQAALEQAKAGLSLANVNNKRTATLVGQGWSSRQQGDTDRTNFNSQTASVSVAQANIQAQVAQVRRLEELAGFKKVVAPFTGVITARQIDVGNLVTADAASGTSLFSIARTDVLRVQVYVPQEYVFGLKDGNDATISVPQIPGRLFKGKVARNAAALAANTRTLLTEVDVENHDQTLSAGLYGVVHLKEPRQNPVVYIPSEAVFFNKDGLNAAVYDDGVVHIRKLDVQIDEGAQVGVRGGLKPGEKVIVNPPVNLTEGMKVKAS